MDEDIRKYILLNKPKRTTLRFLCAFMNMKTFNSNDVLDYCNNNQEFLDIMTREFGIIQIKLIDKWDVVELEYKQ